MILLGDLVIPAIAIRSVSFRGGVSYAVHEVIEGKPRRHFVAEQAPVASLSLYLHVQFAPPRPFVTRLEAVSRRREVLQVWTEAGAFWGTYVIEGVDARPVWTMPDGRVIAMAAEVSLADPGVEWTLPAAPPLAVGSDARDTTTAPKPEDTSQAIETITPQEIARV